jgi:tetratricopeptide (TPR) repeat protein
MKKHSNQFILFILIIIISFTTGCLKWAPGWKMVRSSEVKGGVNTILEKAEKLENDADTGEKVGELIKVYESVLNIEPANRIVLESLARNCFLMAYGYGRDEDEKAHYYLKSIQYSEQALYLNRDFKAKVDNGVKPWEALDVLTRDDMYALFCWYMSAGNYWKECFNVVERVINVIWVKRFKMVLSRMMEIDPIYLHGMPYYLWASFYSGAPSFAGGDLKKADAMFTKAIEVGPTMLNYRRTRARALYTKTGNREAFVRDMEWVLSQDPHKAPLGYPLNVFIQRDAKNGLTAVNNYFK